MNYTYTKEQRDEIVELLLKIQIFLPTNIAPEECKVIDETVKDIYKILYNETPRKIYNSVTKKSYDIVERSSKNKMPVKSLFRK